MKNDEQQIRELVETWISATKSGDLATVLDLMTDDVVFLTPGRAPMRGKAAFETASSGQSQHQMDISGSSEIQEIQVVGDWAYMWTRISVVMTPADGRPIKRAGHTLSVLRKEDGKWKIARDANLLAVVPDETEG